VPTDGGYDIGPLFDDLLARDAPEARTVLPCRGTDGSPLGRDSHQASACMNSVEIEVQLVYRPKRREPSRPPKRERPAMRSTSDPTSPLARSAVHGKPSRAVRASGPQMLVAFPLGLLATAVVFDAIT
jgi:hypothetical protein